MGEKELPVWPSLVPDPILTYVQHKYTLRSLFYQIPSFTLLCFVYFPCLVGFCCPPVYI